MTRSLGYIGLSLYSKSPEDVTFKESEQWQYHVYKIINNKEELVYKKMFPFYSGELKVHHVAHCKIEIPFWKENANVGNYRIKYIHPKNFELTNGSEQLYSVPIEAPPRSYDFYLEGTVTISK